MAGRRGAAVCYHFVTTYGIIGIFHIGFSVRLFRRVLADVRKRVRQFTISFDYMAEEVIAHTTGDQRTSNFVERFAAMGAPRGVLASTISKFSRKKQA
jgi:hypothetical protein